MSSMRRVIQGDASEDISRGVSSKSKYLHYLAILVRIQGASHPDSSQHIQDEQIREALILDS